MKKVKILISSLFFVLIASVSFSADVTVDKGIAAEMELYCQALLDSFGKGYYEVKLVNGDEEDSTMYIDDGNGILYLNINGKGFYNKKNMQEPLKRMGMRGTYANKAADDRAVRRAKNNVGVKANVNIADNMREEIELSTITFKEAKNDEILRD